MRDKTLLQRNYRLANRMVSLFTSSVDTFGLETFVDLFRDSPQAPNVVSFVNHGPPQSIFAVVPSLIKLACENGLERERPGFIFHKTAKYIPVFRPFIQRLTDSRMVTSVDEAAEDLRAGRISMYGTMPEGAASVFEYDHPIGPFEKNGLIVVGLKAGSRFVLCVHKGTEAWYQPLPCTLPFWARRGLGPLLGDEFLDFDAVRRPRRPRKVALRLHFQVYAPRLTWEAYECLERKDRREAIQEEADRMRQVMRDAYDRL